MAENFGSSLPDPFDGRAVQSDRSADTEDYLATEAEDVTFSGQPVGGNEEPAELFEEGRAADLADPEASPEGESDGPGAVEPPAEEEPAPKKGRGK